MFSRKPLLGSRLRYGVSGGGCEPRPVFSRVLGREFPGPGSCYNLRFERFPMKAGIHPAYNEVNVICACAHTFKTRSTHKGDIRVEICSHCHPFFTGRQKLIDTAGRVDKFEKKYQKTRGKRPPQPVN